DLVFSSYRQWIRPGDDMALPGPAWKLESNSPGSDYHRWVVSVSSPGQPRWARYFWLRGVSDIKPALTEETGRATLSNNDKDRAKKDSCTTRLDSAETCGRGRSEQEFDRAPGDGRDRDSGITGAVDPDDRGGGAC